jgi:Transcriptional regulators
MRSSTKPRTSPQPQPVAGTSRRSRAPSAKDNSLVDRFDLLNAPGHLLRRCHSQARAIFDELVGRKTGLSKQQVALMIAIAHTPSATHAQLSGETGFDRNTLADTLDRLIAKGLALRQRSQLDARAYDIQLTSEGLAQLQELIPLSFEVQAKIIEPVPEDLRADFIRCLRLVAGIDAALRGSQAPAAINKPARLIKRSLKRAQ